MITQSSIRFNAEFKRMINLFLPNDETLRVTLLVLPESSMMSLASALDTMRAANRLANRSLFEWQINTLID